MRNKRTFYVLLAVTVVMIAAAVLSQRPAEEYAASHGLHAPGLGEHADDIQTVVIRTADGELRLERAADGWVAGNKDGYPADADRIRALVLGLSRLERLEKKTSDPERLARLELSGVDEPGSRAVAVTLLDSGGETLAGILVGKTEDFQSTDYSRYFVRDAGDPQSWLVRGTLPPVLEGFGNWLEQDLLPGVGKAGLRRVTVAQPGGEAVTIARDAQGQEDFRLAGLSPEENVEDQYAVNQIADTLKRLSLKDVEAAEGASLEEPVLTVEALTFNGVRIEARFDRREPDYAVMLSAAYEPGEDRSGGQLGEEGAEAGDTAEGDGAAPVSGGEFAAKLNERWKDRLFIVSQYALDALMAKRSDLATPAEASGAQ